MKLSVVAREFLHFFEFMLREAIDTADEGLAYALEKLQK